MVTILISNITDDNHASTVVVVTILIKIYLHFVCNLLFLLNTICFDQQIIVDEAVPTCPLFLDSCGY